MLESTSESGQDMRLLVANVAHDLKTPLTSFMTGADMIRLLLDSVVEKLAPMSAEIPDVMKNLDAMKSHLGDLHDTNSFMVMAINRFQDAAKASTGRALLPCSETTNIREALALPLKCMTNAHPEIPIHLSNIPESICSNVITNKQWMQENLLCFLSNAVKYSNGGSIQVNVRLTNDSPPVIDKLPVPPGNVSTTFGSFSSCDSLSTYVSTWGINGETTAVRKSISLPTFTQFGESCPSLMLPRNEMVLIEVIDSGIGISEEKMAMLFQPFQQSQRMAGGTGLGLYSLAKRMEALHGDYGVHKRPDGKQGSVFWFSFPYRPDELTALDLDSTSPNAHSEEVIENHKIPVSPFYRAGLKRLSSFLNIPPSSFLNVLVVDDTPSISKMTKTVLSRRGHIVTTVVNGAAAVQIVESMLTSQADDAPHFDLILMDLQMPVMDGLEATSRIRQLESKYDPKTRLMIVGTSADYDLETIDVLRLGGFDAFIEKPFQLEIFETMALQLTKKQSDISAEPL